MSEANTPVLPPFPLCPSNMQGFQNIHSWPCQQATGLPNCAASSPQGSFFVCEMVVNRNPPVTEVLRGRRGMASVKCLYTQLEYCSLFKASSHPKQTPFFKYIYIFFQVFLRSNSMNLILKAQPHLHASLPRVEQSCRDPFQGSQQGRSPGHIALPGC